MRSSWTHRRTVKQFSTLTVSAAALLVGCQRDLEPPTAARSPEGAQEPMSAETKRLQKAQLERLSTIPMLLKAERMGVTTIESKRIDRDEHGHHNGGRRRSNDVPIATDPNAHENEPTVRSNPKNEQRLVAGNHFITEAGIRCEARRSSNGGRSWSAPVLMPQLTGDCSDPVLAYSPNGRRVYYAYMDVKFVGTSDPEVFLTDFDVLVSYSDNNGRTWTGPFVALDGVLGVYDYDKPWIATAGSGGDVGDDDGGDEAKNYVYLTATRFDATGAFDCQIVFTRSTNGGTAYSTPQTIELSPGCDPVVQGSRPSGGKHGNVLVGWYHSGADGWLNGSFNIRTRYSANFGATFAPIVNAVSDVSETSFWLGPFLCYERWWPSMMPDVEIDPGGGGHLAYTHDPAAGFETAEEGDIRYVRSPGPPYTSWSAPTTVNDDHTISAQGFVALDVRSGKPTATWMDHRLPIAAAPECEGDVENLFYDIFSSTRRDGTWRPNVRISDQSSRTDFIFLGDYIDLTPSSAGLFTIWTDRRDKLSIFDFEDDVWGSPVR